ncbi:transglycosylase domain-containing protein [Dawidia soli]|uniref:Transglycosylase domain-containing protein n=1 Tax=Dawidia soli TaxID=2782352 RepID=A0AAP2GDY7_9BACT|nr:transglycosylase domain-containing protein [Dawidia soli]MBT1687787.1 transglycosylase domain-containing protein [Dawidia soli]
MVQPTRNAPPRNFAHRALRALSFQRSWFKKLTKAVWILLLSFVVVTPLFFYVVSINLFGLFGGMPSLRAIENPTNDLSSEVISADGVSLGRYFRYNRSQVSYEQLSPALVQTLLDSEDRRFRDHSGIDARAYLRIILGALTFTYQGGGSTLTQQLGKNLYTLELDGPAADLGKLPQRLIQKTKELIIAIQIERNYTKDEILTMYLNTVEFGSNAYGIKVASETYFNKPPSMLTWQEAAVLIGMCQNPSYFNPHFYAERSLKKRNEVLHKVMEYGHISRVTYDSLKALPLGLNYSVQNQNKGMATYFRNVIQRELNKWCTEHGYDLRDAGLKIYTTIDSRLQRDAEDAVANHMATLQQQFNREWRQRGLNPWVDPRTGQEIKGYLDAKIKRTDAYRNLVKRYGADSDSVGILLRAKKPMTIFTYRGERDTLFSSMDSLAYYNRFLQTGLLSMDPRTGAIKAWVGGISHKYFKYDHVRQGTRQPGSTFKPFVYGTAIEAGYSPCQEFADISPTIRLPDGSTWTPPNSSGSQGSGEMVTMRRAMALSLNSITAQVMQKVTPQNVVSFAQRLGITSKLDAVPALCLGTSDVTLYEMVAAYCSFVNLGIYTQPYYITRIEDKNGNVLENFTPKTRQVMDELTAYKMIYMLRGGVEEAGGTSEGLSYDLKDNNEIGGKTGTTDNASDGWYMGITHNLVTGVWVGGDERNIHFPSWSFGSGTRTARPIWDKYMTLVYRDRNDGYDKGPFRRPSQKLDTELDCGQYSASAEGEETF